MSSQRPFVPAGAAFFLGALVLAACSDRGEPVAPPVPPDQPPLEVAQISCRAKVRDQQVTCSQAGLSGGASALIVGNQGVYVQVNTEGESYTVGTGDFEFDVSVQNLIPQAMGTTDGTTPSAEGVRLFFQQPPTATLGAGAITVAEDGTGTFTAGGQEYFQYSGAELGGDGILSPSETSSAQNWVFNMPATVLEFTFTLYVAADVQFPDGYIDVTPGVDSIVAGGAQALTATVRSAVGNVIPGQPITWGTGDAGVATVDGSGNVTAVAPGAVTITATSGARSGTASIAVCPNLAVGAAYTATSGSFCLGGLAGGAEYTVVPISLGTVASLPYSLTGSGIVPVSGPPTPDLLSTGSARLQGRRRPLDDGALHLAMLRRQREGVAAMPTRQLVPRPGAGGPRLNITPGVPVVGATMSLNVGQGFCTPLDSRTATVRSVGTRIIIMEDNSNPAGGPSIAQYDHIAATFDSLVYPAVAGNFGAPFDIDTNSRVIALYTAAVNDLTPPASSSFVGGFFYSRDLFSTASCAGSNQGEMFYMLAADPTGTHGNVRSVAFILENTIGTLGHEFEHLINASRRTYGAGG
ncbi:MAG TPA: Ig-like domain-containing protein, partial [Longimicrobiaceae bacterium]|nr:Ig-like domain-containing protein [Longimicrobiaceae bacterium]